MMMALQATRAGAYVQGDYSDLSARDRACAFVA